MKDLIISIFGTYEPVTYLDDLGQTVYVQGLAGVDWPYVLGVLIFAITLYCVLRIIGSVINSV